MEHKIFQDMAERWPSAVVARTEVAKFTGGLMNERYIANLDSAGRGPENRVRIGRKIAYPVNDFVRWLEKRSEAIPERGK